MSEDRQFLEMLVGLFNSELGSENGVAPAGVDQIAGSDGLRRAVSLDAEIDMFV